MKKIIACALVLFISLGSVQAQLFKKKKNNPVPAQVGAIDTLPGGHRLMQVFELINTAYVTSPDMDKLSDKAITHLLQTLDPHSVYIPAKDVERANEGLQGNFDGVGITFSIVKDTINVGDVIAGGPSEKVGLQRGDKILRIDHRPAVGDSIKNSWVMKHLRGKKGTTVVLDVLRQKDSLQFHIVRNKIPINSIDSYFMVDDTIGYIRLIRFAQSSVMEFRKAVNELTDKGMKALILDLRGNGGGYLDIACGLANELLQRNQLIVYQEGRIQPRQEFRAQRFGSFRKGQLVVLIDENSASASEIVSGAVQDWDRGLVIGRRSFGKGLVQRLFALHDGGQVRLTTARYFTPTGRCIQKDYNKGSEAYHTEIRDRYNHGELVNADSIRLPDSLKFKTYGGRTVYGGGGIMPDIFVPMDTMRLTDYYISLSSKGVLNEFPLQWANQHRGDELVKDFDSYLANYQQLNLDSLMAQYAAAKGIVRDTAKEAADTVRTQHSDEYLRQVLKAMVARDLFGTEHYYLVMRESDEGYKRAVKALREMETETVTKYSK